MINIAIAINGFSKPKYCFACMFAKRCDNGHTVCGLNISASPVEDGNDVPDYCPISESEELIDWENYHPTAPEIVGRVITNVKCPKCGKRVWKRTDIVLTSYPVQYIYECDCGWCGYNF